MSQTEAKSKIFLFRFFILSRILIGLTDPFEHRSLTWSPTNTEKSFDSYYMTLLAKVMVLNKQFHGSIIKNYLKKGWMVWTKRTRNILYWAKKTPCMVKVHKCILDKILLVRERMKLELVPLFLWIKRQFLFPDLMNSFVKFYLKLVEYENEISG